VGIIIKPDKHYIISTSIIATYFYSAFTMSQVDDFFPLSCTECVCVYLTLSAHVHVHTVRARRSLQLLMNTLFG